VQKLKFMSNGQFASVWDAIEDTPAEAEKMKLRSALMMALGVTQPRLSDLMRGKIDLFGIDTLVKMLTAAGLRVEMQVAKAA